ncbi:DUF87 domain-containing protein [Campylobacter upsaliensis]|uniref:Type IV secretory pathway, VirB4 components n=1 Tax=Campylobacter upsaliensis TaxID=28080 RepID=A0A448KQ44_CAMUP|nr:DUF87 domain-containing protein [Campylobacter upsaliensis]MCA5589280.1 ATP-binding protein [Campylobacter upsaliensis]VEG85533.1 Type IV secretory pathway, VirB4 components [Campylobacter upsaliensis]
MIEVKNFLSKQNNYYLNSKDNISTLKTQDIDPSDMVLYKVESVTFKKDAPRREALENVLSALRIEGINFIYLILGNNEGVEFYYGIARNHSKQAPKLNIDEIGKFILEPSIKGNFRGSKIEAIKKEKKRAVLQKIQNNSFQSVIEGVPGILKDENEFQGVDRLADVMGVDSEFGFMIIASLVNDNEILGIENNIFELYSSLSPMAKRSEQESTSNARSEGESKTEGTNYSETKGENSGESKSETIAQNESEAQSENSNRSKSTSQGTSRSEGDRYDSSGTNKGSSQSQSQGSSTTRTVGGSKSQAITKNEGESTSVTDGTNKSLTTSTNESTTTSNALTFEFIDKQSQDWLKYIDEILIPRIDYGKGKGMFVSSMFCFSNSQAVLEKLENTIISLFSGENGNKIPLRAFLLNDGKRLHAFRNLQLPKIKIENCDPKINSLLSQSYTSLGNWISSKELSLISGLPKKDVMGLELREEVEFGLNFQSPESENELVLGKLMQSGNITNKNVSIDKLSLDKHIFITGVTGSGKTTTCQNLLINSNKPFLVIEPAKTEYRILKKKYDDLLIFTLGKDTVAPFRLNPFEFFPHESITSRVDMIKASIEAAFDMEAAIPQIIESAIYECYKDKGWNIATNKNEIYGEIAFDDGIYSFPTLEDLNNKIENVVLKQGFDERLKNDYIGSIKARLNGLLVGSKGFMLNTKRSIDFRQLLDKRVVLEIEEIRNGSEKSLIMGFILSNILEAIKANFFSSERKHDIKHIILIEEAHRLLSKYQAGDSLNKKQGVEVFADMLAEIRKYGECLMIADQIPNKLTPEVLKNTNTKIVHRIFAADDKETIANTMALEEEQAQYLGKLETGVAVVFSGGFNKAVMCKIEQSSNTSSNDFIEENDLQRSVYEFYAKHFKSGVILGSSWLDKVDVEDIKSLLDIQRRGGVMKEIKRHYENKQKIAPKLLLSLKECEKQFSRKFLAKYFLLENNLNFEKENIALEFINKYLEERLTEDDVIYFKDELFLG